MWKQALASIVTDSNTATYPAKHVLTQSSPFFIFVSVFIKYFAQCISNILFMFSYSNFFFLIHEGAGPFHMRHVFSYPHSNFFIGVNLCYFCQDYGCLFVVHLAFKMSLKWTAVIVFRVVLFYTNLWPVLNFHFTSFL